MSAVCPTCGQSISMTADELFAILRAANAEVYRSVNGTWHITGKRGEVPEMAVRTLLQRGLIRPTYTTCSDSFTTGRTVDIDATMRERKEKRDRTITVYAAGPEQYALEGK